MNQVTRDEYQQMLDSGIFAGQRFELIDGDLIDRAGQNAPHARTLKRLQKLLNRIFGEDLVIAQSPIDVSAKDRKRNFPEPDIAVLAEDKAEFDRRHPRGDELILVIEVADSSLSLDVKTKRDLYARAGVPEYWVVDLNSRRVISHRTSWNGAWREITVLGEGDSIALGSHPSHAVDVSAILP